MKATTITFIVLNVLFAVLNFWDFAVKDNSTSLIVGFGNVAAGAYLFTLYQRSRKR